MGTGTYTFREWVDAMKHIDPARDGPGLPCTCGGAVPWGEFLCNRCGRHWAPVLVQRLADLERRLKALEAERDKAAGE